MFGSWIHCDEMKKRYECFCFVVVLLNSMQNFNVVLFVVILLFHHWLLLPLLPKFLVIFIDWMIVCKRISLLVLIKHCNYKFMGNPISFGIFWVKNFKIIYFMKILHQTLFCDCTQNWWALKPLANHATMYFFDHVIQLLMSAFLKVDSSSLQTQQKWYSMSFPGILVWLDLFIFAINPMILSAAEPSSISPSGWM